MEKFLYLQRINFFFQAEDGIRDADVTGVQTCALPISIPKRFSLPMRDIWDLQQRLPLRRGRRVFQTREHPRFRAAYDLLLLREAAGELAPGLNDWWTAFQQADEHEQRRLLDKAGANPAGSGAPRKRKRRRRKPRSDGGNNGNGDA